MLQFRRAFEAEKQQLHELNNRLGQYLSRTNQLEHENASLLAEINKLRQEKTTGRGNEYKSEMGELRRMMGQLSFEKSRAEMEREKLWREFMVVQSLCRGETEVRRDLGAELKDCEQELLHAHKTNDALQKRLMHLESEYKHVDDAHKQEIAQLRRHVDSKVVSITQYNHGPPSVSVEEVQQYARSLSEEWIGTFEMYHQKVEEIEHSIKSDQATLEDLRREKMLYSAEFEKLRTEAEKQSQIQMHLEEQLVHMQDTFRADLNEYQVIIEQLESEQNMLAHSIARRLQEHQHLLQVKMDLGMEVAAYRALLEGHRIDLQEAHQRVNPHQNERITDIKMPSQPYIPRAFTSTRQHLGVRYMEQTSQRTSPMCPSGSISSSRVIPISVTGWSQNQSPASRRDMVSFAKARAVTSATSTTEKAAAQNAKQSSDDLQKKVAEVKQEKIIEESKSDSKSSPILSPKSANMSVKVVSPPMMTMINTTELDIGSNIKYKDENVNDSLLKHKDDAVKLGASDIKILDTVSVEEMIEKVIKPAGFDAKLSPSGESKITYHVEKTQQEDGSTKTQIVLESKVEEELDMSEDSALEEFFSRGAKKVSLEDIMGSTTGDMIQNVLKGLQEAEDLADKTVSVEMIEEPVDSDEEYEVEQMSTSTSIQPSTYFQIEELENIPQNYRVHRGDEEDGDDDIKTSVIDRGSGEAELANLQEVSRDSESPSHSHDRGSPEYFVSTPDDNLSEPEEGGGITSYGHYGIVDDLSDERYYQDEGLPPNRMISEESDEYDFLSGSFVDERFPECIIEEEVHVSPTVQESVLEFLKEDALDPKEQLMGALEKIQESASGQLKQELSFFTRVSSSPEKLSVRKIEQSSDNGTTTIVAELKISQTMTDPEIQEVEGDDHSEEQIMSALRSSNPGLENSLLGGAVGGYSLRVSRDQVDTCSEGLEGHDNKGEDDITEKYIKMGSSEKTFTFQMDPSSSHGHNNSDQVNTAIHVSHEKKIATVYLENPTDNQ